MLLGSFKGIPWFGWFIIRYIILMNYFMHKLGRRFKLIAICIEEFKQMLFPRKYLSEIYNFMSFSLKLFDMFMVIISNNACQTHYPRSDKDKLLEHPL